MALRSFIKESRFVLPDNLPPMAAGVFGYLSYDMVRLMEELPPPNPDPIGIPDAILVRPTVVIIFDSVLDTITLVLMRLSSFDPLSPGTFISPS